jgi:acyl-CoA synthetase (AMP-forming)/AMP-acid ligase II
MVVNLALLQERIAGWIPDREAIVWRDRVLTHAELARRSRRLAHALLALGLGCRVERDRLEPWESGQDHVALYLYNCPEFLEAMYGAYKARASAVNINYRYKAEELHYLLANSRARAIVFHGAFAPTLAAVRDGLPELRHFIQVADDSGEPLLPGAVDYETLLAAQPDHMPDLPYTADDLYILYTGGTTGMPKGVLWRHADVFYNGLGGNLPGFPRLETEAQLRAHLDLGIGGRALICLPFMHGAGQWNAFNCFHRGGTVVLPDETRRLDPHAVWAGVERHRADQIGIVGDAFARPLIAAQRERARDLSSLRVVVSTAAVLSRAVKEELLAVLPSGVMLIESIGGSELGMQAMSYDTESGEPGLPAYQLRPGTVLLKADRSGVLEPGGDETGWISSTGDLCLGYLDDPERTRETFPVIGGVRHAVGGDRGRYLPDGRVLFLGREASCINSGGEKIYAEEVERVVKSHPAVYDALVVGLPSERWGQQVTAVVSPAPGRAAPALDELRAHCAPHLADYKVPKALVAAPEIVRSPSGKPDYDWAKRHAAATLAAARE